MIILQNNQLQLKDKQINLHQLSTATGYSFMCTWSWVNINHEGKLFPAAVESWSFKFCLSSNCAPYFQFAYSALIFSAHGWWVKFPRFFFKNCFAQALIRKYWIIPKGFSSVWCVLQISCTCLAIFPHTAKKTAVSLHDKIVRDKSLWLSQYHAEIRSTRYYNNPAKIIDASSWEL